MKQWTWEDVVRCGEHEHQSTRGGTEQTWWWHGADVNARFATNGSHCVLVVLCTLSDGTVAEYRRELDHNEEPESTIPALLQRIPEMVELWRANGGEDEVDGPRLEWSANAMAGDGSSYCCSCHTEMDDRHTWEECNSVLKPMAEAGIDANCAERHLANLVSLVRWIANDKGSTSNLVRVSNIKSVIRHNEPGDLPDMSSELAGRLVALAGATASDGEVEPEPASDANCCKQAEAALSEGIDERDDYRDWADKLAYSIAPIEVIGERSNCNNPWANALEILRDRNRGDCIDGNLPRNGETVCGDCGRPFTLPAFDEHLATGMDASYVRKEWPCKRHECECGAVTVAYASMAHYIAGDW